MNRPDRYLREAATAGFDGLIVPDLPVEESESLCRLATAMDLRLSMRQVAEGVVQHGPAVAKPEA